MVLDVKAMGWAAQNGIDTAKLKAAKVPIYGKWYYPELPARTRLVNLETGEQAAFPEPMVAGEAAWVRLRDLRRAGLGGFEPLDPNAPDADADLDADVPDISDVRAAASASAEPLEPLLAVSRPYYPGYQSTDAGGGHGPVSVPTAALALRDDGDAETSLAADEQRERERVDLAVAADFPRPTIAPLLVGVGGAITLLGLVVHPLVSLVGLAWVAAGAVAWYRVRQVEGASHRRRGYA